jgi:hypothetical protein
MKVYHKGDKANSAKTGYAVKNECGYSIKWDDGSITHNIPAVIFNDLYKAA